MVSVRSPDWLSGSRDVRLADSGEDPRQEPHQLHQRCSPDVRTRGCRRERGVHQRVDLSLSASPSLQAPARGGQEGADRGGPGAAGEGSQRVGGGRERSAGLLVASASCASALANQLFCEPQVTPQRCPARRTATWPTAWRSSLTP